MPSIVSMLSVHDWGLSDVQAMLRSVYPNAVSFFATQITCHKKKDVPRAVLARQEDFHVNAKLPVLTQIEMVLHENCFSASMMTYSSVF